MVVGSLKLLSMGFSMTIVGINYLNVCEHMCVYLGLFYRFIYLFKM